MALRCIGIIVVVMSILIGISMWNPPHLFEVNVLSPEIESWSQTGKYIGINGFSMFYILKTSSQKQIGPTTVFIHGFPSSSFEFHKVIPLFEERFPNKHYLLFDHVGFGLSEKPKDNYPFSMIDQADNVLSLLEALGIKEADFVCHDMGDTIMSEILGRYHRGQLPMYFSNSKLINTVTFTNGGMVYKHINKRLSQIILSIPIVGELVQSFVLKLDRKNVIASAQLRTIWNPKFENVTERETDIRNILLLVKHKGGHFLGHKLISYLKERAIFEHRWHPGLSNSTVTCRLVWGNVDAVAPMEIAEALVQISNGNCKLTVLDGVGHFGQLEAPKRWIEAVFPQNQ